MSTGGEFRTQDGQMVLHSAPGRRAHVRAQWDRRCPPGWAGYNVRAAWREGAQVEWQGEGEAARYHEPSGMLLISRYAALTTAATADMYPDVEVPDDE
jgi:hypothetical protein